MGRILFVDDDDNFLQGLKRQLSGQFKIDLANSGDAALKLIKSREEYGVVLADMQMPGMNGVEFLAEVRKISPNSTRIIFTGLTDQETANLAINESQVFRFLVKPCEIEYLVVVLKESLENYRLTLTEKDLLQNTLGGCIKLLTDLLSMLDHGSFGRASNLREKIRRVATKAGVKASWDIELAAMLANIGSIILPTEISIKARSGENLTDVERSYFEQIPAYGNKLLSNISRLDKVALIVLHQNKHFDGTGFPKDSLGGKDIPIGARIVKVIRDLDELEERGMPTSSALEHMYQRTGWYDPQILEIVSQMNESDQKLSAQLNTTVLEIPMEDLAIGQVLLGDVRSRDGVLLVSNGTTLNEALIERIKNYSKFVGVDGPFKVK